MKYQIQFIAMYDDEENWQKHSETYLSVFANDIAAMLLAQGKHKVRVNRVQEQCELGMPIKMSK